MRSSYLVMLHIICAFARRPPLLSTRRVQTSLRGTWLQEAFDGMTCQKSFGRISPLDFLTHSPIALDVDACLAKIGRVLNTSEAGRWKKLVAVERGTGTGKTTAIEWTLREARLRWKDTLCLGVTFNHYTEPGDDLASNQYKFKDWPMTYAVGVVARMAVGVFDKSLKDVYGALTKPAVYKVLCEKMGELDAEEIIRSCVEYLLERTGKTKIFLALDEALAGEEALLISFPPSRELEEGWKEWHQSNYEAWRLVEQVLLDPPAIPRRALLVSSLERINQPSDTSRYISLIPVPVCLEPAEVLSQWWLVDCSAEDTSYDDPTLSLAELRAQKPRKTIYKPANPQSEMSLLRLAALSASLPRGLEYMKEQLDNEMRTVPAGPDGLKPIYLKKDMVDQIWLFARNEFAERSRQPGVEKLPSPSVMRAWLFNKNVPLHSVSHLMRQSLFTNAIVDGSNYGRLESCVFSWSDIQAEGSGASRVVLERIESLVKKLQDVCGPAHQTPQYCGEAVPEGTSLEVVTMHVMQIKLAALVADTERDWSNRIRLLLYPGWEGKNAVGAVLAERNAVFSAEVSLPEENQLMVESITLSSRLNAKDPVPFFKELNNIDLTTWRFRILRGAPGDCFDVGLLFIDANTDNVCLWLGDVKSAAEHTASPTAPRASLPGTFKSGKREKGVKRGLDKIRAWLEKIHTQKTGEGLGAGEVQEKGGIPITASGRALTEDRVLLAYLSTQPEWGKFTAGDSTRCAVTVVGRDLVEEFLTPTFFPSYALLSAVAAPATKQAIPAAKQVRGKEGVRPAKKVCGE